jgi:hypothetical protein
MSPRYSRSRGKVTKRWDHWFMMRSHPLGNCAYCGVQMTNGCDGQWPTAETRDHMLPRCRGGTKLARVCLACNRDKMHLTVNEWRIVLMWRSKHLVIFYFERSRAWMTILHLLTTCLGLNTLCTRRFAYALTDSARG